jgi:lysozyme
MAATPNRTPIARIIISTVLASTVMLYEHFVPDAMIPIKGDVPTIGYGTTVNPDTGKPVKLGDKIDRKTADRYLMKDLDVFKTGLAKCVKAPLSENEFNAFMSLTYNIGVSAICNSSIPSKLNLGQYDAACKTILQFNKMKDVSKPMYYDKATKKWKYQLKVVKGLDNRRKQEYATCIKGG